MSRLAIFDIDGTLTDTSAVDNECFLAALAEVFSLEPHSLDAKTIDWLAAPSMTDSSILPWLCEARIGRRPRDAERERFIATFLDLLSRRHDHAPHRFAPIDGALGAFAALGNAGWDVALATGGWAPSARWKLARAGIDDGGLVLASASDAASREEIVRLARTRAAERFGTAHDRVVSVGDGTWDVRTAASLRLPFVGIGKGLRADALRGAGASHVLPDLRDHDALLEALDVASPPR
jgi:phosphoglycolate phosphatase-like HAD superfamily hydrolase